MISGKPEKESSIRLLDAQLRSSDMEDRDPIEALKWQYYVTNGTVLKASNQEFDDAAIVTALISIKIFIDFSKPILQDEANKNFFEESKRRVENYITLLVDGSSVNDKKKSQIILKCTDITGKIYGYITKLGDSIVVEKKGVEM